MKKPLTGKEWFQRLETAFPGTLERVCRDSGFRPGDTMDDHVAAELQPLAAMTGGPELTAAMVGHARRAYGIVRRAALPRAVPAPQAQPDLCPPEEETEGDLEAKVTAALERQLPFLVSRISGDLLRALGKEEVPNA